MNVTGNEVGGVSDGVDYPELEPDDIRACIAYAHAVITHDSLDAVRVGES